MRGHLETIVEVYLKLLMLPEHWDTYFYNYFNLRQVGRSREEAKKQAMKMTDWDYKK
jgi:hypothetical protein